MLSYQTLLPISSTKHTRCKQPKDFSCYDMDGVTNTPQGAVQMVFPSETDAFGSMKDLIKAGLIEDDMLQAR